MNQLPLDNIKLGKDSREHDLTRFQQIEEERLNRNFRRLQEAYEELYKSINGISSDGFASQIPYGELDSSSTSTVMKATVTGISELKHGVAMILKNGVVTSASGWTLNVNNLGAKPVYSNMAVATRETTLFNKNYTFLFVYDTERVADGCWVLYRGYDSNTNTIAYQIRSNNAGLPAYEKGYRYRLWFTSADGETLVPANTSTSTNATTARTANTTPINPFGRIVYYSTNGTTNAGTVLGVSATWEAYQITFGYSFTDALPLTAYKPVYLKCTPQADGSAIMQGTTQTLPNTADGYIYIFLGLSYSTTQVEILQNHPVYYHDGEGIRLWNGASLAVGTVYSAAPSAVSLAASTWKTTASLSLPKGKYVISGTCRFAGDSTGRRMCILSLSSDSSTDLGIAYVDCVKGFSDGGGFNFASFCTPLQLGSDYTVYLNAWQNSGGALSTYGRLYAIRII